MSKLFEGFGLDILKPGKEISGATATFLNLHGNLVLLKETRGSPSLIEINKYSLGYFQD